MAGKKKEEPLVTLEKLRDELVVISQKIKKGELTPTVGNAMTNALRSAIYAEQVRLNRDRSDVGVKEALNTGCTVDLSQEAKNMLDGIYKAMAGIE